ncbi:hypothetical protein STEG23_015668, partial [Scotinomys teguina]
MKEKEMCAKEVDFESGLEKEQNAKQTMTDLESSPSKRKCEKKKNLCIPRAWRTDDQVHIPSGVLGPLGTSHDLKMAAFVPQVKDHSKLPLSEFHGKNKNFGTQHDTSSFSLPSVNGMNTSKFLDFCLRLPPCLTVLGESSKVPQSYRNGEQNS